jgi:hypothetical protein
VVGLPLGGPAGLSTWVAPLFGLPVGLEVRLLIGRQHLGAARPTTLVGRVVGLPLGGLAGFFPRVDPLFGLPVGLKVGFLIRLHTVVVGCRLAVAHSSQGRLIIGAVAKGRQRPPHNYGAREPRDRGPCFVAGPEPLNSEGQSCRGRNVFIRVTIVVPLLTCKLVFACEGDLVPARAVFVDDLDGDAAPALGGHLGRSCLGEPVAGPIGRVVWVLPRLGPTGLDRGAAAALDGTCLAPVASPIGRVVWVLPCPGKPDSCALVIVQVVLGDGFGLNIAPALGSGERLLAVGAAEECGFFASRLLVGTRCPPRELRLAHPAVKLGCARGVSRPGRPEVV